MATIYLAGEAIPVASIPDINIEQRKGETTYRVTVTIDSSFSVTQIAACGVGATVAIAIDGITWTGTVTGFGVRPGYSIVQIVGATCAY